MGQALVVKNNGKWVLNNTRNVEAIRLLEKTLGHRLSAEQYNMLETAANNLNRYDLGKSTFNANAAIFYINPPQYNSSINVMSDLTNNRFGVTLDKNQLNNLTDISLQAANQEFDRFTKNARTDKTASIPFSEERIGLLSIFYHQPDTINATMRQAINNGDRHAVIETITHQTPKEFKERRGYELNQFGRPDNPDVIRNDNNSQAGLDALMQTGQSGSIPGDDMARFVTGNTSHSGQVHVSGYVNDNGTTVADYWRDWPTPSGSGTEGLVPNLDLESDLLDQAGDWLSAVIGKYGK